MSEVANLAGVSRTTVYAIKKRMDGGKGVNRRAGSGRKMVEDCDSFRDAIRETASLGMPFERQLAGCHSRDNSLLTTACTSVDAFAIVYALLDRIDRYARPKRFATLLTFCPARISAETFIRLSLCGAILKYTITTNLSLRCHSHRACVG